MIRKFLSRVFSRTAKPKVIPFESHGISRDGISRGARMVTSGLQEQGYAAFVVGGAVRDLLLGKEPKDFDVATSATPEQVRATFRRSRIIGRRFRLVHVMSGSETIEVATFRGSQEGGATATDEHGRLVRDNVFGTQEEDAIRRDFTINALFYDPTTQQIWDSQNGVADVKAKKLRMIGDPNVRFREDPVRMLRAVRLAASLGLEIDARTRAPIQEMAELLANVPAARLFDEMLKLLLSGRAADAVLQLREQGLHHGLLPMLDVILEQPLGERFIMLALRNTDERIRAGKTVSPAFLFAALLWHEVLAAWKATEATGIKSVPALAQAMEQVVEQQSDKLAIPRRFSADMKEVWVLQLRLLNRSGQRPYRVLEQPRFRAAYDFLQLRCASGEVDAELGEWWEKFQHASPDQREAMLLKDIGPKRRRRRRSGRAREGVPDSGPADAD